MGLLTKTGSIESSALTALAHAFAGLLFDDLCDAFQDYSSVQAELRQLFDAADQAEPRQRFLLICLQYDRLFNDMIRFLDESGAITVAFCQGGDFVGGLDGGNFAKGLLRKAMNSFFCRADRPIEYRGTMNEDVVTYTTLSSRGLLFFSPTKTCVIQLPSQSLKGGMSDSYLETGTYLKSFYAVMSMPSCVKVQVMHTKHSRIHHRVDWERCAPKILNEKWRKGGAGDAKHIET